ncbi:mus81 [Drosophila busckii]|uniref:Crossover junction endonuclease MUS81 n=1 Tax=Drosophila busckii TaxID=30019 RepID=A0A0M4EHL8_DROBS|nr:crossover junction endonuclease MUS81 [Drosophila busckii]ALC48154.1 mus81 [Drosophila busckii]
MNATRLEIKLKEPNPLFTLWLERWLREAEQRNQKSQHQLRKALAALRSYPLPLYSGRDCAMLRGFGATLCQLIDAELHAHQLTVNNANEQRAYEKQVQQVAKTVQNKQKQKEKGKPKKLTKKAQQALDEAEQRARIVQMPAGSYDILLLVDTQETSGKHKRVLDQTRGYLQTLQVPHEVRRLTVGDFLWIARNAAGDELVLPYVVERKRMDDLASSIRDGRFHEQKHRLRQCGLPQIIYLIEDYGDNEQLGLPLESLQQALANAQMHTPGLQVVRSENHYRSMCYLAGMTAALHQLYTQAGKTLHSVDKQQIESSSSSSCWSATKLGLLKFRALYEDSARNAQLTVRELFVQQLLQLHSLSLDRALAIVKRYATPRLLLDAYAACATEAEAQLLLSKLCCGALERPLGEKLSQCIHRFYCTHW